MFGLTFKEYPSHRQIRANLDGPPTIGDLEAGTKITIKGQPNMERFVGYSSIGAVEAAEMTLKKGSLILEVMLRAAVERLRPPVEPPAEDGLEVIDLDSFRKTS